VVPCVWFDVLSVDGDDNDEFVIIIVEEVFYTQQKYLKNSLLLFILVDIYRYDWITKWTTLMIVSFI
jgi:hypothetical protein